MLTTKALLDQLKHHSDKALPYVVYRKPDDNRICALLQQDDNAYPLKDYKLGGFIFAPFKKADPGYVIPFSRSIQLYGELDAISVVISDLLISHSESIEDGMPAYIEKINKAKSYIKNDEFEKVVLSRKITVPLKKSPMAMFQIMAVKYPTAFVYLFSHPKIGIWMGATPELLLNLNKDYLTPMSLAGTQSVATANEVNWTSKERDEQQIVTDFLVQELKPLTSEVKLSGPNTVMAGNLAHLETKIEAHLRPLKYDINDVFSALHPSPAICGMPREKALSFILDNEGYERSFYTGFLGEWNIDQGNSSQIYVNLRCMQIFGQSIEIYVGGGITKDSDPESEWNETVSKSKTMLGVIGFSLQE
ncbi:MAG: chorismate-binding protein [Bacteroidia bacterium]|nr:chorismate-binding protein [Bacteroidia bacterium]